MVYLNRYELGRLSARDGDPAGIDVGGAVGADWCGDWDAVEAAEVSTGSVAVDVDGDAMDIGDGVGQLGIVLGLTVTEQDRIDIQATPHIDFGASGDADCAADAGRRPEHVGVEEHAFFRGEHLETHGSRYPRSATGGRAKALSLEGGTVRGATRCEWWSGVRHAESLSSCGISLLRGRRARMGAYLRERCQEICGASV